MTKENFYTRKIAYTAVFVALATIANVFTWFPVQSFALSFAYIPAFFAGYICGPISGLLVGTLGDLLGCLISPKGPWLPTITLASAMLGLIPGLVGKIPKLNPYLKILISYVLCLLVSTMFINTLTLWYVYSYSKGKTKTFWVYLWARLPKQLLVSLINMCLTMAVFEPCRRVIFKKYLADEQKLKQAKAKRKQELAFSAAGSENTTNCDNN